MRGERKKKDRNWRVKLFVGSRCKRSREISLQIWDWLISVKSCVHFVKIFSVFFFGIIIAFKWLNFKNT
jgi:hypothetical protein